MSPRSPVNEKAISKALADVKSGVLPSLVQAADAYGIKYTTLVGRSHGRLPLQEANANQQLLSPKQEEVVISTIRDLNAQDEPVTNALVKELAFDIGACQTMPGDKWLRGFKKRWPELNTTKRHAIDNGQVVTKSIQNSNSRRQRETTPTNTQPIDMTQIHCTPKSRRFLRRLIRETAALEAEKAAIESEILLLRQTIEDNRVKKNRKKFR